MTVPSSTSAAAAAAAMPRANDPPSREASRTVTGIFFLSIIDIILLLLATLWVISICNAGLFSLNPEIKLTLLHYTHLIIILSACVVYPLDVLYVPFWFGLIALIVAAIDVYIVVVRSVQVFNGNAISLGCDFFLWLFDIIFLFLSVGYLAFAARSTSWYGLFGDSDDLSDPGVKPTYNAVSEKSDVVYKESFDAGYLAQISEARAGGGAARGGGDAAATKSRIAADMDAAMSTTKKFDDLAGSTAATTTTTTTDTSPLLDANSASSSSFFGGGSRSGSAAAVPPQPRGSVAVRRAALNKLVKDR